MIYIKTNIYTTEQLTDICSDAESRLETDFKINKVGNKFAVSNLTEMIVSPFNEFNCKHWYAAYFQHTTSVFPHTDNDSEGMFIIGIIPLYWNTEEKEVTTIVHNESSDNKVILKSKEEVTNLVKFVWRKNSAIFFPHNMFHSSGNYQGIKTGIQIIGWK